MPVAVVREEIYWSVCAYFVIPLLAGWCGGCAGESWTAEAGGRDPLTLQRAVRAHCAGGALCQLHCLA